MGKEKKKIDTGRREVLTSCRSFLNNALYCTFYCLFVVSFIVMLCIFCTKLNFQIKKLIQTCSLNYTAGIFVRLELRCIRTCVSHSVLSLCSSECMWIDSVSVSEPSCVKPQTAHSSPHRRVADRPSLFINVDFVTNEWWQSALKWSVSAENKQVVYSGSRLRQNTDWS